MTAHHQPFVYFANYADGQPGRAHLKDEQDFLAAASAGMLPTVSFVKPVGIAPPAGDKWGPGSRVPTIVISPFAKKGNVDHTVYDTTSILATIEKRFSLQPLTDKDKNAAPMLAPFGFTQ